MAETPQRQRSGGSVWNWILGFIALLLLIWIISGLFGNGTDDTIAPPNQDEPVPQEQQPQQPQQQDTIPPQSHNWLPSEDVPHAVAFHNVVDDWPRHHQAP